MEGIETQTMIDCLTEIYHDQLRELHHAECQLSHALAKMALNASNPELRRTFEEHLEETREQLVRLERLACHRGIELQGNECEAMRSLLKDTGRHLSETLPGDVSDAVLIAAANRIEHYEIAAYGAALNLARQLGFEDDLELLEETLAEETAADRRISGIASGGLFHGPTGDPVLSSAG